MAQGFAAPGQAPSCPICGVGFASETFVRRIAKIVSARAAANQMYYKRYPTTNPSGSLVLNRVLTGKDVFYNRSHGLMHFGAPCVGGSSTVCRRCIPQEIARVLLGNDLEIDQRK